MNTAHNRYIDFCDRLALRRLLPRRGGKIADICGGFGRLADEYLTRYQQAVLFDYAPQLLAQAESVYGQTAYGGKLRTVQGTVYAMPFPSGEFDTLIMVRAALHLNDLNAAVGELARILKTGGTAIIELANKRAIAEILRRCFNRSAFHPFSPEPESRHKTGFYYYHPRYAEQIFTQNGLHIKKAVAVSGLRLYVPPNSICIPLLYALEYLLQYAIGWFKWSSSVFYLLGKGGDR